MPDDRRGLNFAFFVNFALVGGQASNAKMREVSRAFEHFFDLDHGNANFNDRPAIGLSLCQFVLEADDMAIDDHVASEKVSIDRRADEASIGSILAKKGCGRCKKCDDRHKRIGALHGVIPPARLG